MFFRHRGSLEMSELNSSQDRVIKGKFAGYSPDCFFEGFSVVMYEVLIGNRL